MALPTVLWPLRPRVAGGRACLVDRNGDPFLVNGDSGWEYFTNLTSADRTTYLDDRVSRGMNSVLCELYDICFPVHAPNNINNDPPFPTPNDYSSIGSAYFTNCDAAFQDALDRNVALFITENYLGFAGASPVEGWYAVDVTNGNQKLYDLGKTVGARYKSFPNVTWIIGGDRNPADGTLPRSFKEGLLSEIRTLTHSAHCAPESSGTTIYGSDPWFGLNTLYTYWGDVYTFALSEFNRSPTRPFVLIESEYENGGNDPHGGIYTAQRMRLQMYYPMVCGATGQFIGNEPGWRQLSGWQSLLGSRLAIDATHWGEFFRAIRWHDLIPDQTHVVFTSGLGSSSTVIVYSGNSAVDRVVGASTADGNLAVACVPSSRAITVDRTKMSGTFRARTFDPTNGTYTTVSGSPFPNTGTMTITPPTTNSTGDTDSVLILEAVDR